MGIKISHNETASELITAEDLRILTSVDTESLSAAIQLLITVQAAMIEKRLDKFPSELMDIFHLLGESKEEILLNPMETQQASQLNAGQIRDALHWTSSMVLCNNELHTEYFTDGNLLKLLFRLQDLIAMAKSQYGEGIFTSTGAMEDKEGNPIFWFEEDGEGNALLLRPDGQKMSIKEKNSMYQDRLSHSAWQRAMLFIQLHKIEDVTAFASMLDLTLAIKSLSDEKGHQVLYTFSGCQKAEKHIYSHMDPLMAELSRNYVDAFYENKDLQIKWNRMILHPVCIAVDEKGNMRPVSFDEVESLALHPEENVIAVDLTDSQSILAAMHRTA